MNQIDWDKPLRNIYSKEPWEHLFTVGHERFCRSSDGTRSFAHSFDETGRDPSGLQLENIPQEPEPERENGLYLVINFGRYFLYSWDGGCWLDLGFETPAPDQVLKRIYTPSEYRPADICPPPMDGTPFEVEGEEGRFGFNRGTKQFIQHRRGGEKSNIRWDLFEVARPGLRWKPIQP